ncbi:tail fiber protein [Salmonella enterica]|nr:tail fiber protein [Salmonella enterica]
MKPLMKPIDTPDRVFHDGDPSTGELGTICSAEWLNDTQASIRDIQAECITILRANGFEPDETKRDQLWEAIQAAIKNHVPAASLVGAGIVQLSSSVTSDSETIAATLKAVKIAMDNGSARMAKDRNGSDIPNKALFRQNLELGNSATLDVGTTANTVAAGDDARIVATKKAIDDTQTGLAVQGVMWISTADDLSNLPAGARRFARNNTGVTVLPAAGYFFLEVLAKRDTANGSCILATSDTRDVWIGFRYTVPDEAGFTWIQLNQNVQNLGLTEAVNRALNAVQKTGDTMTGNLFLKSDNRVHFAIVNEDGNARMWLYKDKGGDGVRLSNGVDGASDFVFSKDGGFYSPGYVYAGAARLAIDGNVWGTRWNASGAWLWDTIAEQLTARDTNINTRATWDWVSQNFVNDIFLGTEQYYSPGSNTISWIFHAPNGHVLTGINVSDTGSNSADNINGVYYKAIQKRVNGVVMTIAG